MFAFVTVRSRSFAFFHVSFAFVRISFTFVRVRLRSFAFVYVRSRFVHVRVRSRFKIVRCNVAWRQRRSAGGGCGAWRRWWRDGGSGEAAAVARRWQWHRATSAPCRVAVATARWRWWRRQWRDVILGSCVASAAAMADLEVAAAATMMTWRWRFGEREREREIEIEEPLTRPRDGAERCVLVFLTSTNKSASARNTAIALHFRVTRKGYRTQEMCVIYLRLRLSKDNNYR